MSRGTVAVRFDGCRAALIPSCTPSGTYTYLPITVVNDGVSILDARALITTLPPLAHALEPKRRRFGAIGLELMIVGRWQASPSDAIRLSGTCDAATHVITGIDVGAYSLVAGASEIAPPGAEQEVLEHSGDRHACNAVTEHTPPAACAAIVRVELTPIARASSGTGCASGMRWNGSDCEWNPRDWCSASSYWNGTVCAADLHAPAAQTAYLAVDARIRETFDASKPGCAYSGPVVDVIKQFRNDAAVARELYADLQAVADAHPSPTWQTIVLARQGALYHALDGRLRRCRPPMLRLFSDDQERILGLADVSENPALRTKANAVRLQVFRAWQDTQSRELSATTEIAVDRYATTVVRGGRERVAQPAVDAAVRALADLTPVLGDAELERYVRRVRDVEYSPGLFVRMAISARSRAKTVPTGIACPNGFEWSGVACTTTR